MIPQPATADIASTKWVLQNNNPPNRPTGILRTLERIPADAYLFRMTIDVYGYTETNTKFLPPGILGVMPDCIATPIVFENDDASRKVHLTNHMNAEIAKIDAEIAKLRDPLDAEMLSMDPLAPVEEVIFVDLNKLDEEDVHEIETRLRSLEEKRRDLTMALASELAKLSPGDKPKPVWGFHMNRSARDSRNVHFKPDALLATNERAHPQLMFLDTRFINDPLIDIEDGGGLARHDRSLSNIRFDPTVYGIVQGQEVALSEFDFRVMRAFGHLCYVRAISTKPMLPSPTLALSATSVDNRIVYVHSEAFYRRVLELRQNFAGTEEARILFDAQRAELTDAQLKELASDDEDGSAPEAEEESVEDSGTGEDVEGSGTEEDELV
jgi:hypothetical protein